MDTNDPPVTKLGSLSTAEDVPVDAKLEATDVDGDALTFTVDQQSPLGTLVVTNAKTGAVTGTEWWPPSVPETSS